MARYADSSGFEQDFDRPNAWRYRDYVIRAFNQDKPYDVFLKEQIAGDELDTRTDDTLIATGFLRAGPRGRRSARRTTRSAATSTSTTDRHDRARRAGADGPLRALPQPQVRSDPAEGLLQPGRRRFFGYVETDYPLAPREEAEAYEKKIAEIDARRSRR